MYRFSASPHHGTVCVKVGGFVFRQREPAASVICLGVGGRGGRGGGRLGRGSGTLVLSVPPSGWSCFCFSSHLLLFSTKVSFFAAKVSGVYFVLAALVL